MSFVSLNIEYFPDPTRGVPVYNGYIYIGEPDTDPEIDGNQKTVVLRQSDGTEVVALQPLRTSAGGVVLYNGSPVQVLVEGNYSLKILNEREAQVYYIENATGVPAGLSVIVGQGVLLVGLKAFTSLSNGMFAATAGRLAYRDKGGGSWVFNSSDLSTEVATDPESGIYAAPDSDPTGASGAWVRQYSNDVNVQWFGAVGDWDGATGTDDTVAFQAAINYISSVGEVLYVPSALEYLITDTLALPMRTQIRGDHRMSGVASFGQYPLSSTIYFNPTSEKDLFHCTGDGVSGTEPDVLRMWYSITGLYLKGNSSDASGLSRYAIDADGVLYSRFSDIGIDFFQTGIRTHRTQNNRFEHVYIDRCYVACVFYDSGTCTTDVWAQCSFRTAPVGIQTNGSSVGIRFHGCVFEALISQGVNLVREARGWSFVDCYAESVPLIGTAGDEAMFRVGYDGTTVSEDVSLTILGGRYTGHFPTVGMFVDADGTKGVHILGTEVGAYRSVIKTTLNTKDYAIQVFAIQGTTWPNGFYQGDIVKLTGLYPSTVMSTSSTAFFRTRLYYGERVIQKEEEGTGGHLQLQGDNVTLGFDSSTVRPQIDDSAILGAGTHRWARVICNKLHVGTYNSGVFWTSGAGTPEGSVFAGVGSMYTNTSGGAGTTLYVKELGNAGTNTGWVAK